MNMNSLIIVADPVRARFYRTGHPNDPHAPVELIEIDNLAFGEGEADAESARRQFAHRIVERAAAFAFDHYCNPVILTGAQALAELLLPELEHELPQLYIRPITADLSALGQPELLRALEKEEAFSPRHYPILA
jgi:hypothetical protein